MHRRNRGAPSHSKLRADIETVSRADSPYRVEARMLIV
jgi:hypothetical protein